MGSRHDHGASKCEIASDLMHFRYLFRCVAHIQRDVLRLLPTDGVEEPACAGLMRTRSLWLS